MNNKMMFLAPGMVLGAVVIAAPIPNVKNASVDKTVPLVHVGREKVKFDSTKLVKLANTQVDNEDFDGAIKTYSEAVKLISKYASGTAFSSQLEYCQKQIKRCYLRKAEKAMQDADEKAGSKDFEAAIKMCREAQRYCPEKREELAKKIVFYETRRKAALQRENTSMAKLAPEHGNMQYKIQLLLEQGREFAHRNELTKARRKFEEALLVDPFNMDAMQNLEGVNARIRNDARLRATATARKMTAEVEWAAAIPIVSDAPIGEPKNELNAPVVKTVEKTLLAKLNKIIIPRFAFEEGDFTFSTLMEEIRNLARNNDPDRRGVNFVARGLDVPEDKEPAIKISLNKKRISVYKLLEDLQKLNVLSFKVGDNAVMVAPADKELEDMEVRYFPFTLKKSDTSAKMKKRLTAAGITFGKGSSVELLRARNLIIVRNTPENLKKIGAALVKFADSEPMVQVMFKFIEVSQSDLDELGFNWNYQRYSRNGNITDISSNDLLRHYNTEEQRFNGTSQTGTGREGDLTYEFRWSDNKNYFSAGVYALDWADSTDVLYSPRVTTLSNTEATINMSEKHYYPEDWETADTESIAGYTFVPSPQPSLEDEQETGITFKITPKADKKTGLIDVDIDIPIRQFVEWMTVDARTGEDGEDGEYIKKPVLSERTIRTVVSAKDGETILLGGMAMDNMASIDDKVPILGDIPFIGRFFQSKYVKSQKSHLLVFMTCRMIKPDGSAINPKTEVNGLPDFHSGM